MRSRRCSEECDVAQDGPRHVATFTALVPVRYLCTDQLDNDIGEEEGGRERRLQRALDMRHVHMPKRVNAAQ